MLESRGLGRLAAVVLGLAALGSLGACASTQPDDGDRSERTGQSTLPSTTLGARFEQTLPWGGGASGVTLQRGGEQQVAEGPSAVALRPDGLAVVLDRLAERILLIDAEGVPSEVAAVARDVEDLATGRDGSLVAWSPLRATAWLFAPNGSAAATMAVPRELHMLQRLSIGPSMRLRAHTGYQQTLDLGSPAMPQPLAATLRSTREGAETLPDGRAVRCHVADGVAALELLARSAKNEGRSEAVASHSLPLGTRAARVVGLDRTTVCVRLESVSSTLPIAVERRALCLDAVTGAVTLDEPLGRPGLYLPRTELAVGGGRLAFIRPTDEGLRVTSWRIRTETGEEVQP